MPSPLDTEGLALAADCVRQVPSALRVLDEQLLPDVRRTLLKRAPAVLIDDVMQKTRVRLLLGDSPALSRYAGKGPLLGFLRTVALNLLAHHEAAEKPVESEDVLATLPDTAEMEAGLLRADQQQHFRDAFREAVAKLTARQRALLRLSLLDELSIDEIAPLYAVNRSSIARWLAEARETLAQTTRAELKTRLKLEGEALEHLLRSVQNRFDLSLASALKASAAR
ncbi:MAG: sigma-70 family RNA polymerase sigma factor [Myxococcaceae bacterium]|nr:sigma-70 family RNA polymerase sigma factor [Myxococcaceae bacterium]